METRSDDAACLHVLTSCNLVHECRRFVSTDPTALQVVISQTTVKTMRDYHSRVAEF